ncbi:peptidyl-dipeptidase A [Paenibacillus cellulosilyticus]|uniref:Peptidyl-dipeptidase A n=1 Tax=Paenibacillus cellulosilyticus TaxID=375489 RepID=A0A2V2Z305_9BACL|nr:M2 family metallopeptidase [Paenibacillus cellulosilyticus]PWW03214.1 peptidyl-dipeptidase A [Paenibacillus cellulosilyticus]QKS43703.1 M2 family metallopeptidase [Paenibacillus cellulosilyticus]
MNHNDDIRFTELNIEIINNALATDFSSMMDALWQVMITGDAHWADEHAEREQTYLNRLTTPLLTEYVIQGLHSAASDEIIHRQLTILNREMREYGNDPILEQQILELWNRLHYRISTFRAPIDGASLSNRQISTLLNTQRDSAYRKRIWEAGMRLGEEIAPGLLELVNLRNQVARAQGFDNYFLMKLELQGIAMEELDESIVKLREGLDPSYRQLKDELDANVAKKLTISSSKIEAWHYQALMLQRYPARQSACNWDINKIITGIVNWLRPSCDGIDQLISKADLLGRVGKSQANCCLNVDRKKDIRLMCNLSGDTEGLRLLLHELGHAFYECGLDESLPFILRQPAHPFLSEAVALLFERMSVETEWLKEIGVVSPDLVDDSLQKAELRRNLLMKLYATIAIVEFEKELYHNPTSHLNDTWWYILENVQRIRRPDNWDYPYWAANAHLTTLPVYYYNYLWGEAAASQLQHSLQDQFQSEFSKCSLDWLRNRLAKPGSLRDWAALLNEVSGTPLNMRYLIEDLKV